MERGRRFLASVLLASVVLITVGAGGPDFSQTAHGRSLAALVQDTHSELEITWNPITGTPSFIRGQLNPGEASAATSSDPAIRIADRYAKVFGIKQAAQELTTVAKVKDSIGIQHVTMGQQYQGIPVYDAYMKIHIGTDGEALAISNGFVPGINLADTNPAVSPSDALATARNALPDGIPLSNAKLVIYLPPLRENPGAGARLAWVVELRDDSLPARNIYVVDALEGIVLDVLERLATSAQTAVSTVGGTGDFGYPVGELPLTRQQGDADGWTVFNNGFRAIDVVYPGCVHPGDDWNKEGGSQADVGQVVRSIGDGTVVGIKDMGNLGFGVAISHTMNDALYYSVYIHVQVKSTVEKGKKVLRGDPIGTIENFGGVSPHLHFEVRRSMAPDGDWYPTDTDCDGDGKGDGYYSSVLDVENAGFVDPLAFIRGRSRQTFSAGHTYTLPGTLALSEYDSSTNDKDVDNAHDFAAATYDYYHSVFGRNSYDSNGGILISTAHYGNGYRNAFWNGEQMVYGDDFPVKDVAAHELTHGVTENSAALQYRWQSGALNESFSDIFGVLVDRDDWTIGEDLPAHLLAGRPGIRDMANPPRFGQPEHTKDWVKTCSDNEGVHTNSGITNKAFYNVATAIGKAKAEHIFYRALTVYLQPTSSLEDARAAALQSAQDLYGTADKNAVATSFNSVGLDGTWQPTTNNCECAVKVALSGSDGKSDLPSTVDVLLTLYRSRSQLFETSIAGRYYRELYEKHTGRISYLLLKTPELRNSGFQLLKGVTPGLKQLMNGKGNQAVVSEQMVTESKRFLEGLAAADRAHEGGDLARAIEAEMNRLELGHLAGMTFQQARDDVNLRTGVASVPSGNDNLFPPTRIAGASGKGDERDIDTYSAIAYDPTTDRYLTVWTTARNAQSSSDGLDVYGVFLDNTGQSVGGEFRISGSNNVARNRSLAVAGGDGKFAVAWAMRDPFCRVYVQSVVDSVSVADSVLVSGTGHVHSPSLTYNPVRHRYVLAFVNGDDYLAPKIFGAQSDDCGNNSSSTSQIEAVEFYFAGNALIKNSIVDVADADNGAFRPHLSFSPELDQYLVVWEDRRNAVETTYRFDVYGKRLAGDLTKIGADIALATGGDYANYDASASWTPRPVTVAGADKFLVSWFAREVNQETVIWSVLSRFVPPTSIPTEVFVVANMPFAESHSGRAPTGSLAGGYSPASETFMIGLTTHLESIWGYFSFALIQRVNANGHLLKLDGSPQSGPGVGNSVDYDNDDQIAIAIGVNPVSKPGIPQYVLAFSKHSVKALNKDFDIYGLGIQLVDETVTPTPTATPVPTATPTPSPTPTFTPTATPIPGVTPWGLAALAVLMAVVPLWRTRRQATR